MIVLLVPCSVLSIRLKSKVPELFTELFDDE